jgi:H+/Cl- antiporter ClcA
VLLSIVALAGGASVGREGPTVQVGASLMHALRRYARFSAADVDRGLILAGGAAGVTSVALVGNYTYFGATQAVLDQPRMWLVVPVCGIVGGLAGGLFAPSLAVGAGIGAELGSWIHVAPAGAVVVLTMASYFSGVVQAPLTALVIVAEMTGNRGLTLPLMAVVLIGRGASAVVCRRSLYRSLAEAFVPARGPDRG